MNEDTNHFRPRTFDDVIGQEDVKEFLQIKINSFKKTGRPMGHLLLLGFSGSGKTTLANVVANEMGTNFISVMGTRLKTWNDLHGFIKQIRENDVLFIDEIHCLTEKMQEHLYGLMEDFTYTVEDKQMARPQTFKVPKFTLIGATTHAGSLKAALLGRFGFQAQLMPYSIEDLTTIVIKAGKRIYNLDIPKEIAIKIANLSRRTARKAYTILANLVEVAEGTNNEKVTSYHIDIELLKKTIKYMGLDPLIGLDRSQRKYLTALLRENNTIGIKTLASMINEQEITVNSYIEPFLLSDISFNHPVSNVAIKGPLAKISQKGRVPTQNAKSYLNLCQQFQKNHGFFVNEDLRLKTYESE